ncbi:exosortase/archaeosortase family protein [Gloeobacter kilaueensis]|uniref:Exosortase n=1 Tax=Gloeobacter kilaueensis (strain ATCC BAA-2537 / CCAP 1431/1 / ULC 316 / JS1) TaxID=1183438 RepID=U5QIY7_GLOK1|nr:exosortase/archaeosortase family protein [Gloeobacter kilaueensis]AGY57655.1 hypothetical protein GKIL_1409 [Gloeobacter kilaueensis JS1]
MPSSLISPSLLRLWLPVLCAGVLGVYSLPVLGEWLAAWFSYGTYSALFTYGAVGIPALGYLGWSKAARLGNLTVPPVDRLLGIGFLLGSCTLIGWAASKDVRFAGVFLGVIALCTLVWGLGSLRLLWQELGLLLLAIPFPIVFALTHNPFFQQVTAQGAAFMLWYTGIPAVAAPAHASQIGVYVLKLLDDGHWQAWSGVAVAQECSGTAIGFTFTYLSFLIPALLPVALSRRLLLATLAPVLAIFCNTARVAFLVYLQAYSGRDAFLFWHAADGRLIYSFATLLLFGLLALWIVRPAFERPPAGTSAAPLTTAYRPPAEKG